MARWKARGRLPIGDKWTFFASYHGLGPMNRYLSKFRCLKGGGLLWTQILGGKGRPPPTIFGTRKLESLGYRMVKKIAEKFNRLSRVHQRHRRQADRRQTDTQTTDGISIAYSKRNVIRWRLLKMWITKDISPCAGIPVTLHCPSTVITIKLSLIHIWRCRRSTLCRSRWSPYH